MRADISLAADDMARARVPNTRHEWIGSDRNGSDARLEAILVRGQVQLDRLGRFPSPWVILSIDATIARRNWLAGSDSERSFRFLSTGSALKATIRAIPQGIHVRYLSDGEGREDGNRDVLFVAYSSHTAVRDRRSLPRAS